MILLRNGQFVPLPQAPGEVALETIAAEFGDTVQSLILALAQSKADARDAVVAAFPAQVSKIAEHEIWHGFSPQRHRNGDPKDRTRAPIPSRRGKC